MVSSVTARAEGHAIGNMIPEGVSHTLREEVMRWSSGLTADLTGLAILLDHSYLP